MTGAAATSLARLVLQRSGFGGKSSEHFFQAICELLQNGSASPRGAFSAGTSIASSNSITLQRDRRIGLAQKRFLHALDRFDDPRVGHGFGLQVAFADRSAALEPALAAATSLRSCCCSVGRGCRVKILCDDVSANLPHTLTHQCFVGVDSQTLLGRCQQVFDQSVASLRKVSGLRAAEVVRFPSATIALRPSERCGSRAIDRTRMPAHPLLQVLQLLRCPGIDVRLRTNT